MFFCLVVGSRSFNDYQLLANSLDKLLINKKDIIIVSGGANGTDQLAERYAKEKGYACRVFKADWKLYGKFAGKIRNEEMHRFISKQSDRGAVAFWDGKSRGTYSNFALAEKYGNPLRIVYIR